MSKALSYIHRTKIRDEVVGQTYSFHPKEGEIVKSQIYIPDEASLDVKEMFAPFRDSPRDGMASFASLIERVEDEIIEKRCKSQATRESYRSRMQMGLMEVVGLQKELSLEQNQGIWDRYIKKMYLSRGLLVSAAIHFEEENPHAHVFVGLRAVDSTGFSSRKERDLLTRAG